MLNRNIPVYEGNLPYLYACYSPEDEMLVLPILARMYNEGFRVWSACLVDKVSDFVAVRHVSTSACVMMFMSHNMLERINSGVPEVLAACRSSLLRTVVMLDDARPDSKIFAITVPERLEYQRSNDASFWLYAYSADYLERCRGPWPEIKISVHEPVYDEVVHEEAIAAEYISLENIITRGSSKPEQPKDKSEYPNNRGYIQPGPDPLTYEPLGKVEAARTEHDRDFDDALSLLNQCAEKQIDIIINHTRPGENSVPAKPSLSPIKPMPDKQAEMDTILRELADSSVPAERPERRIDPEVRTKADIIIEPEEKPEPEPVAVEQEPAEIPAAEKEPIPYIPQPEITVSSIAASIKQLTGEVQPVPVEETAKTQPEQVAEAKSGSEETAQAENTVKAAESSGVENADTIQTQMEKKLPAGKSTVQVVVRRQQPTVRVTPVRKRVISEPITQPIPSDTQRSRPKLNRSVPVGRLRMNDQDDAAAFEEYIRDIALAAVSAAESPAEEAPVSHRRFGRWNHRAEEAEATTYIPVKAVAASASEPVQAESEAMKNPTPQDEASDGAPAEKVSARKSRYPHNSEVLTGLIAALRREREAAQTAAEQSSDETTSQQPVAPVAEEKVTVPAFVPQPAPGAEDAALKVIRLSDAISERRVSDLQAAVNKFMSLENVPESAPVTARACLRRR